jgi:hypothetical protein
MAIWKAPNNKAVDNPTEDFMPEDEQGKREKICDVQGHRFSPAIMHLLEVYGTDYDKIPVVAICIRCGGKIKLNDITI